MGLEYNDYVLIGVDVNRKRKEIEFNDKYLPYVEGHRGVELSIVNDYENQKFLYFGKVLAEGDKYEGITKKEINLNEINEIKNKVKEEYENVFNEACMEEQIKLIACTVIR